MKRGQSEDALGDAASAFEAPPVAEMDETRIVRPVKAYKNMDFLNSHSARTIRIMAEHQETLDRLEGNGVKDFVLVRHHLAFFPAESSRGSLSTSPALPAATAQPD